MLTPTVLPPTQQLTTLLTTFGLTTHREGGGRIGRRIGFPPFAGPSRV